MFGIADPTLARAQILVQAPADLVWSEVRDRDDLVARRLTGYDLHLCTAEPESRGQMSDELGIGPPLLRRRRDRHLQGAPVLAFDLADLCAGSHPDLDPRSCPGSMDNQTLERSIRRRRTIACSRRAIV